MMQYRSKIIFDVQMMEIPTCSSDSKQRLKFNGITQV